LAAIAEMPFSAKRYAIARFSLSRQDDFANAPIARRDGDRMSGATSSRLSAAGQRGRSRKAADEDAFYIVVFEFVRLEMSDFQPKQRQYVRI
jgi:hypothetical protein